VDLEARTLHVKGKGRRDRLIPLPRRVVHAVAELAVLDGLEETDYLWYRQKANRYARRLLRERPIVYSGFNRWWKRTLEVAHVAYKKPHTTRHTYATKYLRAGGKLERLSRILGHSSVGVTEAYYAHLDLTDLAEDADLVMAVRRWEEGP
jgi:integrase